MSLDVLGTANIATNIDINVNAAGGNASNGTGGDAYGGYADIYAWDGGKAGRWRPHRDGQCSCRDRCIERICVRRQHLR